MVRIHTCNDFVCIWTSLLTCRKNVSSPFSFRELCDRISHQRNEWWQISWWNWEWLWYFDVSIFLPTSLKTVSYIRMCYFSHKWMSITYLKKWEDLVSISEIFMWFYCYFLLSYYCLVIMIVAPSLHCICVSFLSPVSMY